MDGRTSPPLALAEDGQEIETAWETRYAKTIVDRDARSYMDARELSSEVDSSRGGIAKVGLLSLCCFRHDKIPSKGAAVL